MSEAMEAPRKIGRLGKYTLARHRTGYWDLTNGMRGVTAQHLGTTLFAFWRTRNNKPMAS